MKTNQPWRLFYHILANNLLAGITNNFVWFALTFWVYLETKSVFATSWIAGTFALLGLFGGFIFGPIVDHNKKHKAMLISSLISFVSFSAGALVYFMSPEAVWNDPKNINLWLLIITLMIGVTANNLRMIAQSTIITMPFSEDRDKANGLVGASQGISFSVTSILSGLTIGFFGIAAALIAATVATLAIILHLLTITLDEPEIVHLEHDQNKKVDIKGTFILILAIPGLLGLIIFNTFNNFLGGVFMALMDAYGLSLVSVETWGLMWGVLSLSIIGGSLYVSKYGVGSRPIRLIMVLNVVMWVSCMIFPLQASIYLLAGGMFIWLTLFPIIEAAEQTVMQQVVPLERQGRVFGLAQSMESIATPLTTFFIGPIAQFIFIPFMTTGAGVALIGDWFGTGADRGMALVFICAGLFGLIATLIAWSSRAIRHLGDHYEKQKAGL